jgi:hypothetical protein
MSQQFAFDFDAPIAQVKPRRVHSSMLQGEIKAQGKDTARERAEWVKRRNDEARAHWSVGMVTSLPLMATIKDVGFRYTQMLPGVVESIEGDTCSVRIYAAPEYGYTLIDYPLHLTLAIDVPLAELGVYHRHDRLQSIVDAGALQSGDAVMGQEIRARAAYREAA